MDNSTKVDIIPNIPLNKKLMNDIHNQNNPVIAPQQNESKIISENQNENFAQKQVENSKEIEAINPKKIRKRTTKKEADIRKYKCTDCDKSYLSYPALYTHCKQKHNRNNHSERGRGRPKKEQNGFNGDKNKYNPLTSAYFEKEERTGCTKVENINECIKNSFLILYGNEENRDILKPKIESRKMKMFTSIEDHPFLGKFFKDAHDIDMHNEDEKTPVDLVLIEYLNKMSIYCNPSFYEKLIVFTTLFREHINLINQDKMEENKEFTQEREAEDVPESSNEFITDFLFPNEQENEFGLTFSEAIDLTRNICNWMYLNNFTCSKLFLLDN